MSKSSNKQQLQHLLMLMLENPEIARGFFKEDRQKVQRFWQRTEVEINALGPPSKNFTEWKKVGSDQKKHVRQKAAQNLQHQKGTGGGPNISNSSSKLKTNVSKENVRSSYDISQAELAVQNDLVATLKEVVVDIKEQQQSLKKIYRSIDKMYDLKKQHFQQMANIEKEKLLQGKNEN